MHEMAIAQSLLDLAVQEAAKHGCSRITRIVVQYGALSQIMPEALSLGLEILTRNTAHENLELVLEKLPLILRCPFCQTRFGGDDQDALWQPCPNCGESFGHMVEQGRELLLARVEADCGEAVKAVDIP